MRPSLMPCLALLLPVAAASAAEPAATAPLQADAIGRPYYDCVHEKAFLYRGKPEPAIQAAHGACEAEAAGMEVKLLLEFEPVFAALGPGLREPQEARLKQNVQEMVAHVDAMVLEELTRRGTRGGK